MVRLATFPVIFGASLLAFVVAFFNRRRFFPDIDAIHERKAIETHEQALEFRQRVAEGVAREREDRRAR